MFMEGRKKQEDGGRDRRNKEGMHKKSDKFKNK